MTVKSEPMNFVNDAPAIDFASLLGRCLGNFKMVERVLAKFRDTGLSDLNQLQQAAEVANIPAVIEISHRFKGSASNVSALGLRDLLLQVESLGHDENAFELTNVISRLRSEWESFLRFAQVFAPKTNSESRGLVQKAYTSSGLN